MFNETEDVNKVVQIYMEMRLNPGLNRGSNEVQRIHKCQQSHINRNGNAFEPKAQEWHVSSAWRAQRQGGRTRKTVRENYGGTPAANPAWTAYKTKWFQTFLPGLNWAVWEKKLESHIGCMQYDTTHTRKLVYGNHCEDMSTHKLVYGTKRTHTHTKLAKCLGALRHA